MTNMASDNEIPDLFDALRDSPLARAVRDGLFGDPFSTEPFEREREFGRDLDFWPADLSGNLLKRASRNE